MQVYLFEQSQHSQHNKKQHPLLIGSMVSLVHLEISPPLTIAFAEYLLIPTIGGMVYAYYIVDCVIFLLVI